MPLSTYESLPPTSNLLEPEKPASELTPTEVEAVLGACCLHKAAETSTATEKATEMASCYWKREELSGRRRRTWYRNVKRRRRNEKDEKYWKN